MIPALTLWQPWASLIFLDPPVKRHETRSFPLPDRLVGEKVAIHAAARSVRPYELDPALDRVCLDWWGRGYEVSLPTRAVLGAVRFEPSIRVEEAEFDELDRLAGDFSPGRWAWPIVEVEQLRANIRDVRGRQGFWKFDYPEFVL